MTGRAPLPYDFMSAVPSFELRSDGVADRPSRNEEENPRCLPVLPPQ